MIDGRIPDDNEIYLRQISLGVRQTFFEYFYDDNMTLEEKNLTSKKVILTIEYLKNRLRKGYAEYRNIYDENYQFIKGKKLGIEVTNQYYKLKKTIKDLITFYTLDELQEILKDEFYDAIFEMYYLPKYSFFQYFYNENISQEQKVEIQEKVKVAIEFEKCYFSLGYEVFTLFYDKNTYTRFGIKKLEKEKRLQLEKFINRIIYLIEPYSLKELQEICNDNNMQLQKLQLKY